MELKTYILLQFSGSWGEIMGIAWLGKKAFSMESRWQTKGLKPGGDF